MPLFLLFLLLLLLVFVFIINIIIVVVIIIELYFKPMTRYCKNVQTKTFSILISISCIGSVDCKDCIEGHVEEKDLIINASLCLD